MAEQMTSSDRAAVRDRIVDVPAAAREPAVVLHEEVAALKLTQLIGACDLGGIRRFVHELEHGSSPWRVDPWRLIEHMTDLAIRHPGDGASHAE